MAFQHWLAGIYITEIVEEVKNNYKLRSKKTNLSLLKMVFGLVLIGFEFRRCMIYKAVFYSENNNYNS